MNLRAKTLKLDPPLQNTGQEVRCELLLSLSLLVMHHTTLDHEIVTLTIPFPLAEHGTGGQVRAPPLTLRSCVAHASPPRPEVHPQKGVRRRV